MKLPLVKLYLQWYLWASVGITEAQRYHCACNFTAASVIPSLRVLYYCREIYFTAPSFILLPQGSSYCREFYFTAARFILLPRVLFNCREFYFHHRKFFFNRCEIYFTAASFIFMLKLGAAK